ncbi:Ig-like domain-containing protein [Brevibacillus centrosporus]|uniref:SbsA Ig-like domain-containing protein n=1 Tax=Brevibacillus centrosporus TaxID=54910 RepID=A0A1I3UJU3_9BACL|nr:Ig-like domain-containing protein [Brevibacillus centrosporus]SFJ83172.1 hypothetical protein SAMN05518846_1061 [Brevibacillus centrosporus]
MGNSSGFCAINAIEFEVKFNSEVNESSAENPVNYTITGANLTGAAYELQADKKTVKITLTAANKLTANTAYLVEVKDVLNKDLTAMPESFAKAVVFTDSVKPTLGAVSYPSNATAKVSFSEPMAAIATTDVKVYDETGADVTNSTPGATALGLTASTAAGAKDVVLSLNGATANKTYTVKIFGAKDLSDNLAGTKTFTVTKTVVDEVKPTIANIAATSLDTFDVTFSEDIVGDAAGTAAQTPIEGFGMLKIDNGAAIELINGDAGIDSVVYDSTTKKLTVDLTTPLTPGAHVVSVYGYTDGSGNTQTTATSKALNFQADQTAPAFQSLSISQGNLLVTFDDADLQLGTETGGAGNEPILAGTRTLDNVEYAAAAWTTAATLYDPANTGKTNTVAIALPAGLANGKYSVTLAGNVVADQTGNANVAKVITFDYNGSVVSGKPVVVDDDSDATNGIDAGANFTAQAAGTPNEIVLKFNKDVTDATALNVSNYLVDGEVVFEKAVFVGDKRTVKLTLKQDAIDVSTSYPFTIQNVKAASGETMTAVEFNQAFVENVAPTITSAKLLAPNSLEVTFSENMKAASLTDNDDFEVLVDGVKHTTTLTASGTTNVYTIALGTALSATDLAKAVEIKVLDATDAVDATPENKLQGGVNVVVQK